jgi:hypothetical protein
MELSIVTDGRQDMLGSNYLSDWMWMASAFLVLQLQCMLTGPENWGQTWGHPSKKPLPATKVWQFFNCWVLVSLSTKEISMWRLLVQESKNLPTYLRTYLCDKLVEPSVVEFHVFRRNSGFSYFCDLMGTPIRFCAEFFQNPTVWFWVGWFLFWNWARSTRYVHNFEPQLESGPLTKKDNQLVVESPRSPTYQTATGGSSFSKKGSSLLCGSVLVMISQNNYRTRGQIL